jgi:Fe-S-cluster containining protein
MGLSSGAVDATWSFHCTACGKCCNSAPQMTVPELFHHQNRFVGSLAIRRVPRLRAGQRVGRGASGAPLGDADAREIADLADAVLHPLGAHLDDVWIGTQALSVAGPDRCPALGSDMRCTVHDDRKPAACAVVPLDALVPDRLQHRVLAERRAEAAYLGADCIVQGTRPGAVPMIRRLAVVDTDAADALARHRRGLVDDKRWWGTAVFGILQKDLFAQAAMRARIPVDGFVVLAIAPVLVVLASVSARCRVRCVEYVDAQLALIDRTLGLLDGQRSNETVRSQLHVFARTHRALRGGLANGVHAAARPLTEVHAIERWMGPGGPPSQLRVRAFA